MRFLHRRHGGEYANVTDPIATMPLTARRKSHKGTTVLTNRGSPSRLTVSVEERLTELGVDPFEIIALIAAGDACALGWMTEEEMNCAPTFGRDDDGRKVIIRPSGREVALSLLPPGMRLKAAIELAGYLHGKKSQQTLTVQNPDGSNVSQGVAVTIVRLPDNGRTKAT